MTVKIEKDIKGSILDIGGGGEGIIGRIYKESVIAIDNRQDELDEAPDCCEKRLMDARNLLFKEQSFDNVTFFYSLMYMKSEIQIKAISEAARVLKSGGRVHIWDSEFKSIASEPYISHLDIVWENEAVHTSYGIIKDENQSAEDILGFLKSSGLSLESFLMTENHFFIRALK